MQHINVKGSNVRYSRLRGAGVLQIGTAVFHLVLS